MRKIEDIKTPQLQITAQPKDTYVRPAAPAPDRLEKIAEALVDIEPTIGKYLTKKQTEKDDFEIAQGIEIFKDMKAEGRTGNDEDIERGIATNDPTVFKKLTKTQKQGVYIARHQLVGQQLQTHLGSWAEKQTIKVENENGEMVDTPLASVKDQSAVIDALYAEADRYVKEQTGGRYDPQLFSQYIQPQLNAASNTFIQRQAQERKQQIAIEAIGVYTNILNGIIKPQLADNSLITNGEAGINQLTATLQGAAENMMASGFSQKDAMEMLAQTAQATIRKAPPDAIEALSKAFASVPMLSAPDIQETLKITTDAAEKEASFAYEREKQRKEDEAEEKAFDLLKPLLTGGKIDETAITAFSSGNPTQLLKMNYLKKQIEMGYENLNAMDNEAYNDLYIQMLRGKMNYNEALQYAGSMNKDQIDSLLQIADHNETKIRQARAEARASGGYMTRKQAETINKKEKTNAEKALKVFYDVDKQAEIATDDVQKRNIMNIGTRMSYEVFVEYEAWKADASAESRANPFKCESALNSIAQRIYSKYKDNLSVYQRSPELMNENPRKITEEDSRATINTYADRLKGHEQEYLQYIRAKDVARLDKLLKKYDGNYKTGTAAKIISANEKLNKLNSGGKK